ncbi:MAG: hypothetical protein R3C28_06285 [Pirellulaceae bacterium]
MNRSDFITSNSATDVDLTVRLGRLTLPNPVLLPGTFGYAREMQQVVPLERLGGMILKTVTRDARVQPPLANRGDGCRVAQFHWPGQ